MKHLLTLSCLASGLLFNQAAMTREVPTHSFNSRPIFAAQDSEKKEDKGGKKDDEKNPEDDCD